MAGVLRAGRMGARPSLELGAEPARGLRADERGAGEGTKGGGVHGQEAEGPAYGSMTPSHGGAEADSLSSQGHACRPARAPVRRGGGISARRGRGCSTLAVSVSGGREKDQGEARGGKGESHGSEGRKGAREGAASSIIIHCMPKSRRSS